ncbi:MAG TPA: PPC domain-containing protein, partial [Cytophagales bacterium]|nr:PPC domain-containing protein [Cytophagales bacterium]
MNAYGQCPDVQAGEPNNALWNATEFTTSGTTYGGVEYSGDEDYYRIVVSVANYLNLSLNDVPADFELELYDGSGTKLVGGVGYRGTTNEIFTYYAFPGTYYVKVSGYNNAFSNLCYRLQSSTGSANSYEPNESKEDAVEISTNYTYYGGINPSEDVDFYSFNVYNFTQNLEILLEYPPADYDIILYDAAGNELGASSTRLNASERIIFNYATAGTYYIKVSGYYGESHPTGDYVIKANTSNYPYDILSGSDAGGISEASGLNIYPNPAISGQDLIITLADKVEEQTFRIFGTNSNLVSEQKVRGNAGEAKLSLDGIAPGIYVVHVGNGVVHKL